MRKLPLLLVVITAVTANPVLAGEPSPARQKELRNMLNHDCGACHGLTLKGGLGPALLPEALAGKPDDFLIATILEGRPGTAMPPWRPFMNRDEAAWLVGVLRKIK
jgi:cytochrome c55X